MKWKTAAFVGGLACAVVLLVFQAGPRRGSKALTATDIPGSSIPGFTAKNGGSDSPRVGFPDDPRPAVQCLYRIAEAARFYNFDPRITGYREERSPFREDWTNALVGTPTHFAQVVNGRVIKVNSLFDGSDIRRKPEAMNQWYQATGIWTEAEALRETLAILGRLNDSNTLNETATGTHEFRAVPNMVRTPDAQQVQVTPFPTVRLMDSNNVLRVRVEFRMGATGVLGVTEWFSP